MRTSWIAVTLVTMACGACGGSLSTPFDDGGVGDGGASDTGVKDSGSTKCPATVPADQSSCSLPDGFTCEYGSSNLTMCNQLAMCNQGKWLLGGPGPDPQQCGIKNPPACPSTFASVPTGQSCSKDYPTSCEYPQGSCACTINMGGPFPADAASVAKWYCSHPDAQCPMPRPKVGSDCNVPSSVTCDYGACILPGATVLQCNSGSWQETPWACAN